MTPTTPASPSLAADRQSGSEAKGTRHRDDDGLTYFAVENGDWRSALEHAIQVISGLMVPDFDDLDQLQTNDVACSIKAVSWRSSSTRWTVPSSPGWTLNLTTEPHNARCLPEPPGPAGIA
jgi:hypothetical protein